ncbi:MAG: glycosyltransferase [Opitutaceae bacterium]|nr:glycosyltransferase [Opitutaceae bacterium]
MSTVVGAGMRLVFVTSLLREGGAERVVAVLASGLADRGHEVRVLVLRDLDGTEYATSPAVEVEALRLISERNPWWRPAGLVRLARLRRALRIARPELVISFQDKLNAAVVLATRGLGVPVVCTEHVVPSGQRLGVVWGWLRTWAYRRAALVVAPTEAIASELRPLGARVEVLAYPAAHYSQAPCNGAPDTRALSFRAAGRLAAVKGFDRLIDAFAMVAEELPEWTLELAGEGELRAELESRAEGLGLGGRVRFRGRVADVVGFFGGGRVAVISSQSEAFPMVLLEAWASGTPVAAIPSAGSLVEMGGDAVAWAGDERVAGLASVMRRLATEADLAARLAELGRERYLKFAPGVVLDAWEERTRTWRRVDSR